MQGNVLLETFSEDYGFLSKAVAKEQKIEYDYLSLPNNTMTVVGHAEIRKNSYLRVRSDSKDRWFITKAVEYKENETKVQYKPLLSIFDVEVYQERNLLKEMSVERFIGKMVADNFINNSDPLQNIPGLSVVYMSETPDGALNLKDNLHNIYDVCLNAFRKYGIVVEMDLDVMKKQLQCRIGKARYQSRTIEADLKNITEVSVTLKDSKESVNKVVIVGEYDEESPSYGKTEQRIYYLDKKTGETTMNPAERMMPVCFRYKTIGVDEEFEEKAYQEAYDLMYQERQDNFIKIKMSRNDKLHRLDDFKIGQPCTIMKDGTVYNTVFTGYIEHTDLTLLFGMIRVEYTKKQGGLYGRSH